MNASVLDFGQLLSRDIAKLQGVHEDLVRVVVQARDNYSFIIVEGLRTIERQRELLARGATQTLHSRHLTGHAVDICPWTDFNSDHVVQPDEINWKAVGSFREMAAVVKDAAAALGIPIEWGGDWKSFYDGPHFQLPFSKYP